MYLLAVTYALSGNIWVTCRIYELSFHSINQALSNVEVDNIFFLMLYVVIWIDMVLNNWASWLLTVVQEVVDESQPEHHHERGCLRFSWAHEGKLLDSVLNYVMAVWLPCYFQILIWLNLRIYAELLKSFTLHYIQWKSVHTLAVDLQWIILIYNMVTKLWRNFKLVIPCIIISNLQ